VAIAKLPDVVRGYEDVKLRNVALFRERTRAALRTLASPDPTAGNPGLVVRRTAGTGAAPRVAGPGA
jgi:indolepyruvate ferredoxin oxidoreductase